MKNQHTPGPWVFDEDTGNVYAPDSDTSITDFTNFCYPDEDEARENARLIAAAPDLLAACQAFVLAWDKSLQLEKTDTALQMARAAIAKTTPALTPTPATAGR